MGELALRLAAGLAEPLETEAIHDLHTRIRKAVAAVEASAEESVRERRLGVLTGVDPAPLGRTLRRLHQDLLMLAAPRVSRRRPRSQNV
ncbi:MAG TPA: hypothetical protein VHY34_02565 [Caulobacteraceae bacterium]|jgi:hypothetical protein|nr:hypothetical protein [Caulobacteraceae bacterium]